MSSCVSTNSNRRTSLWVVSISSYLITVMYLPEQMLAQCKFDRSVRFPAISVGDISAGLDVEVVYNLI